MKGLRLTHSLPLLVILLSVLSSARLLAVGLPAFHLGATYAPGESEADVAAGEGTLAGGGVVGVDTFSPGADGVEEVVDIEEERESAVEEVGAYTTVEAEIGVDLGQQGLCSAAIDGIGEDLKAVKPFASIFLPQFRPEVEAQ